MTNANATTNADINPPRTKTKTKSSKEERKSTRVKKTPTRDICKAIDRGKKEFITSAKAAEQEDAIEDDQPTWKLPP